MKRIISNIIISCVCVFGASAITIDEVIDSVKHNNVALKIAKEEQMRIVNSIKSSNNLSNPEVGFEYHKGANIDGDTYGFSLTQKFDWPGLYVSRSQSNKHKIEMAHAELLNNNMAVLFETKQLCIQIVNVNKKIKAQEKIYDNMSELYAKYEKGFNQGEISMLDINKLKIEMLNVKRDLDMFVAQRSALGKELMAMNGNIEIVVDNLTDYPIQSLESVDYYLSQIETYDPEYIAQGEGVKAANVDYKSAKMGWLPEFSLGYRYTNELGTKFNGFEVGVSLPLFANRNKVGESKAGLKVAEFAQKDVLIKKESALKADFQKVVTTRTQINSYKNVLDDETNIQMLKKALEGGEMSLLNYLLELRYFLEAHHTLLDLEYEYNMLLTSINKYELISK